MLKENPSFTAKFCAFARAYHSNYAKEKIYDDYLAFDFLGKEEYEDIRDLIISILNNRSWQIPDIRTWDEFLDELIAPVILTRMKYAEEKLLQYAKRKGKIQYVICGAGLDTFAFRNTNKNIEIFELDHPNTHNYKIDRIRQLEWNIPDNTHYIPIDFEKQNIRDTLLENGFKEELPAFFAILGVAYYLELTALVKTLEEISKAVKAESLLVFDYPDKMLMGEEHTRMQVLKDITSGVGEQMKGGMTKEDLVSELAKCDYTTEEVFAPRDIQEVLIGKKKLIAFKSIQFITAKKREVMKGAE